MIFVNQVIYIPLEDFLSAPVGGVLFEFTCMGAHQANVEMHLNAHAGYRVLKQSVHCEVSVEYAVIKTGSQEIGILDVRRCVPLVEKETSPSSIRRIRARQ